MPIIDRDPDSDLNQVKPVLEDLRDAVAEPHAKPSEPATGLRDGADYCPRKPTGYVISLRGSRMLRRVLAAKHKVRGR
jgi:hypothetical protein